MTVSVPPKPKTSLLPAIEIEDEAHVIKVYCVGLEAGEWRHNTLAQNLMAWLPDFALIPDEGLDDQGDNSWERFRHAAEQIYKTGVPEKRGEIGELVLHILCRTYFDTFPSVSKLYYKSSRGEVVKGFDLVHTKYDEDKKDVEFWFGESKFYQDGVSAAREAIKSIKDHLDLGFLKSEKIMVFNKVVNSTPGFEKIEFLLNIDTSIDELTKRMVLPVLITFDSKSLAYAEIMDENYIEELEKEVSPLAAKFLDETEFAELDLRLLFVPTDTKLELLKRFDSIVSTISTTGDT